MVKFRTYLIVTIAVLAVFARTAGFSYIGLDDAGYTFRNPFVATGVSWANIAESFTNFRHGGIWMPLTYISYMIDIDVSRATGIRLSVLMHLASVVLHLFNSLLLLYFALLLSRLARNRTSPHLIFLAVVFWAVHPMRAEPVSWIACRKELMWVFFSLMGLICWLKYLSASLQAKATGRYLAITFLFCAAACLSKPTAMCFPVLAVSLHLFVRAFASSEAMRLRLNRASAACYLAMFAVALGTALAAAYSQTHVAGQDAVALFAAPFHHRAVHALSAIGFYIRASIWPSGLHIDFRQIEGIMPQDGVANLASIGAALLLAAIVLPRVLRRGAPGTLSAFLLSFVWFIVPMAPTLGLFGSFGIEAHADRFTYLPMTAIALLAATIPLSGDIESRVSRHPLRKAAYVLVAVYGIAAFRQVGFWKDDYTAHLRALDLDPEHPRAMVHVGDALCARTRNFDKGIEYYRRSLKARAREYVKYRLAYALASRGGREDYAEVKRLGAAVAKDTSLDSRGMMLDALGTAYMAEGDWESAIKMFKASIAAPGRFWPKASTKHKLDECLERIR